MKIRPVYLNFSFKCFAGIANVIVINIIADPGSPCPENEDHLTLLNGKLRIANHFTPQIINMIILKRTNSADKDFQFLSAALEHDLQIRDGEDHLYLAALNTIDTIDHVIVVYSDGEPVGCGAIREYSENTMEVKRMYVIETKRRQGIASGILRELETWCAELSYKNCILETGKNQPEAIQLYQNNGYRIIPNFGKYIAVTNSVCFIKEVERRH